MHARWPDSIPIFYEPSDHAPHDSGAVGQNGGGVGPGASTPGHPGGGFTGWRPRPGLTWQWQLEGRVDVNLDADVFDLDAFDTSAATVAALHAKGRKVICYVDVGAVESYRPDAGAFPAEAVGRTVDGWDQERYLDVRRLDLIGPVLLARFDQCRAKGFDGVEGDLVDAYDNDTGFHISEADQVRFLRWFAAAVHDRGMAAGLKNVPDLIPQVLEDFEFAVVEDCHSQGLCAPYRAFTSAGKAVFDAEYHVGVREFCEPTRALGISAIAKRLSLDGWRETCD